jgi:hypothetical protein
MSKPRNSILNLFDPLASPDSDKENSSPTRFTFFRLAHHEIPVKLTRRLVDVGDITVQDHELPNNDQNDSFVTATPCPQLTIDESSNTSPRTPLAELPLEHDVTPVVRSKTYKRSPLLPSDPDLVISPPHGILSVINEVNSSGMSFASPSPRSRLLPLPDEEDLTQDNLPSDAIAPQIIISSADSLSNSVATLDLEMPSGSLITDTTRPFDNNPPSPPPEDSFQLLPILRPTSPNTSTCEANRHSVDLYSTFQLHLQSEEASFDLLNDKVSFFASGSDTESFFGDDSFDMAVEEANMEKALEKMKSEEKLFKTKTPPQGKQQNSKMLPDSPVASGTHPLYAMPFSRLIMKVQVDK